jgi:membrane-bound lytic murein transglycosylase D
MGKNSKVKRTLWMYTAVLLFLAGAWGAETDAAPGGAVPDRPVRATIYAKPVRFTPDSVSSSAAYKAEQETENSGVSGFSQTDLDRELTRRYIDQYSSPGGIAWLNTVINRGSPYISFIQEEIKKMDLPPELVYLPVIESAYNATAVSRSGAAGLWQFMKNSMGPFDMKVNDWMDERLDFWKSTQGALRKLNENYRTLGDWPLALAAYNAGLGGVSRVVARTGLRDYWALCERKELRSETIHYVPKFLAAAYILSRPRRFGINWWPEKTEWTRVAAGRSADLEVIAREAGLDADVLKAANRELRFNVCPPDSAYFLKVPAEYAETVQAVLENKDLRLIRYHYYTIKYGDTLSALSAHYGVSVDLIQGANPGIQSRYLQIGQRVQIPAFKDVSPYTGKSGARTGEAPLSFTGSHLVKKGETLWAIALAYDVDPEVLADVNGMELNETLREGRSLKTPIR